MSEQTSDIHNNNQEERVQSAIKDITLIRQIIDHTEINMQRLGWLLLVYGLVLFAYSLFENSFTLIAACTASIHTAGNVSIILSLLIYVVIAVLFILFLRKRAVVVKTESKHTMKLFDLWGVIMFVPAVMELALFLAVMIAGNSLPTISAIRLRFVFCVVRNTALIMCIFFTGLCIGSRFLKISSAVLIVMLIVLFSCGISPDGTGVSESNYFMLLTGILNIRMSIASFVQNFVYLGMGIYCIMKQRGSIHGDE